MTESEKLEKLTKEFKQFKSEFEAFKKYSFMRFRESVEGAHISGLKKEILDEIRN